MLGTRAVKGRTKNERRGITNDSKETIKRKILINTGPAKICGEGPGNMLCCRGSNFFYCLTTPKPSKAKAKMGSRAKTMVDGAWLMAALLNGLLPPVLLLLLLLVALAG